MKRFASHYLLIPDIGFIKQQVVEINDEGIVQNIFPLTEEIESVEWMPGVIVLSDGRNRKHGDEFEKHPSVSIKSSCCCQSTFPLFGEVS